MKTSIPKNNFSSGQIDRDLKGRFDLPLYQNGFEISRNFFHTIKGDCYYRTGFEYIDEIRYSALYEFKFNQEQAYLLVFDTAKIKFWSYNQNNELVRVLDKQGGELSISHPYGNEIFNLNMTQNCDVLYIAHNDGKFPEYQLKRTASNEFTLTKTQYTNTGTPSLSSTSASENHGFPFTTAFYENRLNRCSSSKYLTYLYGSKGADYNNITVGTGTNDGYQFDLAEANSKALWLMSGINSLLVGTAEGVLTINGGSTTQAITPSDITAKLSCRVGTAPVKPICKDNFVFFVSSNRRFVYMFEYDVLLEQFKATNLSKANYEITKGGIRKLASKFDRFELIYALCGNKLLSVCFSNDEAINSWAEVHTKGEFVDMCTVTRPDGNSDLFANIKRVINGKEKYYLERLTETVEFSRFEDYISEIPKGANANDIMKIKKEDKYAFYRQIAEELRNCNYLDCSMKYDGLHHNTITLDENGFLSCEDEIFSSQDVGKKIWYKSITGREYGILQITDIVTYAKVKVKILLNPSNNTTSEWYLSATHFYGLKHLEGEIVSVFGNGGYVGDFLVKNGQIDISNANVNKVGSAVIGLKYKGVLKSPNLGLSMQGMQTFTNMKNIYKIGLQMSFSAGGKIGSNMYDLENVQDFNTDGLYDIPPLPMDGYKEVLYSDDFAKEKNFYIVQDSPLPFHLTAVVPYYKHVPKV